MNRLQAFLASIAPGLFLIGYNIGTGSITTMAASGAAYGMKMIWPLVLSCVFTYFLIIAFGKFTAVTGQTVLHSYRQHFGSGITMVVLIALLLSEWVSSIGVMAIVVQVVQEWSRPLTESGNGFSPFLLTTIFAILLYWIYWQGKHRFFERILAVFVGLMGLSFLLTTLMVKPDGEAILRGLIPQLPTSSDEWLIMAGMVGTTMGAILFVVRSILVQEKGWGVAELKWERRDARISVLLMLGLSAAIMMAAAGTLHLQGQRVENAIDMVRLLEPLAGRFAISIFVGGIVCAGLSSLFPIVILAPWLIADYEGKPREMTATRSRLLVLFGVLLGFVVPIFGGRPVSVMITSQAAIAIASPIVLILMVILLNRPSIMGKHIAKRWENALYAVIILFTILMAIAGLKGIFS
ncbi:MAG: divalent metal cation transporter [Bacteroidota bacterium]